MADSPSTNTTYLPHQPVLYEALELNQTLYHWLISNLSYDDLHYRSILENLSYFHSDSIHPDSVQMSREMWEEFIREKLIERPYGEVTQATIIVLFVALMLFGALGNSLVCWVVLMNAKMRTQRNFFVVNLAISDLTLCVITQAFNLYRLLMNEWGLGVVICKLSSMFAATNVFVSTASITAIALDRFQVIVYPMSQSRTGSNRFHSISFLLVIWLVSLAMASPLAVFNKTEEVTFAGKVVFLYCVEKDDMVEQRKAYSIALLFIQYVLPIVIVCVAHVRISRKLRYRLVTTTSLVALSAHQHTKIACPGGKIITDSNGLLKAEGTRLSSPECVASCGSSLNSKQESLEQSGGALNNSPNDLRKSDNNRMLQIPLNQCMDGITKEISGLQQQKSSSSACKRTNAADSLKPDRRQNVDYAPVLLRESEPIIVRESLSMDNNKKPNETDNGQVRSEKPKYQSDEGLFDGNCAKFLTASRQAEEESPWIRQNLVDERTKDQTLTRSSGRKILCDGDAEKEHQDAPVLSCPSALVEPNESADAMTFLANKRKRELRRKRRTNTLLVLIAVIFAASWMPLNVANILVDFQGHLMASLQQSINNLLFPVCHLIVLCSACLNPLLYGWLNDNFRREFVRVLGCSYLVHLLARRFVGCARLAKSLESGSLCCCCSLEQASTDTRCAGNEMVCSTGGHVGCFERLCPRKDDK